jgi:ABC-type branched-subunit amino acid transport system substrate-binding protein
LAPLAEEYDVVLVGLLVSAPTFTEQNEWLFKYCVSPEADASSILAIVQDLKVSSLGILYLNDTFGQPIFELLKKGFETAGGTVKYVGFDAQDTDFTSHIATLKDMDAICAVGFPPHLKLMFQQLQSENFQGVILGGATATTPAVRNMPEANGVYTSAPVIYNPNYLFAKETSEKYTDRYNKPLSHEAGVGYDFVKLLAGLLEDEEVSRKSVKRLLEEGFNYPGVFGDLELQPGERDLVYPLYPARIRDGEITYLR